MARKRRAIPVGNFVFKNKANAKGKRTVYLRYYVNGRPVMCSMDISIREEEWNSQKEAVISTNPSYVRLNERLIKRRKEIDEQIESYPGRLTPGILRDIMDGTYTNRDERIYAKHADFIDYASQYILTSYKIQRIATSTCNNDLHSIKLFRDFIIEETGEEVLPFKELNVALLDRYKRHCLKRGNQKPSINKKLKPLLKAIDYAGKNGIITTRQAFYLSENGYYDLRNRQYESEVEGESIRYLTEEQMMEFIRIYHAMGHYRTKEYMEMFLFAFYACGLRFSDILTLEWSHIDWERKMIHKNIYKEKKRLSIPVMDKGMDILERWRHREYNDRFVFNLLPEEFDISDAELLDMKRKSKSKSLQVCLNTVGKKFTEDLPFNLSFHVARHSFAVYALRNGVATHHLSEVLGHRSLAATEKFYAKFLADDLSKEVLGKLNSDFNSTKA